MSSFDLEALLNDLVVVAAFRKKFAAEAGSKMTEKCRETNRENGKLGGCPKKILRPEGAKPVDTGATILGTLAKLKGIEMDPAGITTLAGPFSLCLSKNIQTDKSVLGT